MSINSLKSSLIRTASPKPTTAGMPGSRLSTITAAYRQQQATQTATTTQTIADLTTQRKRLATAEATAEKPLGSYLQQSGQMVERRIGSLQARLDQIIGRNKT